MTDTPSMFVGRAGEKLDHALSHFHIDVAGKTCADFGSSVGGFVDCLLKRQAAKVYSVETGYGVLDWRLRQDPRVVVMDRTNAMHVALPEKADFISIDTSWTKQEFILPNAYKNIKPGGIIVSLIKPHYEADKRLLHQGKLSDEDAHRTTLQVIKSLTDQGLDVVGYTKSPITGGKAENTEYLVCLKT